MSSIPPPPSNSTNPMYPQAPEYVSYYQPVVSPRPTSVSVLAIIGIVFGVLGLVGLLAGTAMQFLQSGPGSPARTLNSDPAFFAWGIFTMVLAGLLSAFLLTASIAAMKLSSWSRKGLIVYGIIAIVYHIVIAVVNAVYVLPRTKAMLASMGTAIPGGMDQIMSASNYVVAFLKLVYPVCLMVFMTRRNVIEAFSGVAPSYLPQPMQVAPLSDSPPPQSQPPR